jgi:hypothetical protein
MGENVASCLLERSVNFAWIPSELDHPRGAPDIRCACGFYGMFDIEEADIGFARVGGRDVAASGADFLALGVVEGHGRVLVGEDGWRSERARVLALYASLAVEAVPRALRKAAERYEVPLYTSLRALAAEWGPDRTKPKRISRIA